jgi:hypothetical protein
MRSGEGVDSNRERGNLYTSHIWHSLIVGMVMGGGIWFYIVNYIYSLKIGS